MNTNHNYIPDMTDEELRNRIDLLNAMIAGLDGKPGPLIQSQRSYWIDQRKQCTEELERRKNP